MKEPVQMPLQASACEIEKITPVSYTHLTLPTIA